ncbi:Oidioi.mRNA.OKI2018_I69.XSR.g13252.t1.cds [Oikopleura dioica]|uniref:Oidioi.mRNA.OKI2018_I69.XSR.g13252.t1.cds n=1 Tax=Oikopleura dioica TaxID=34765 RepID=A0ABN7SBJ3_OIKDI|nr:Oidioi.mRNA.OKI2018_I69.XSR.g13252.t1.cds [Oikopleura dioica]
MSADFFSRLAERRKKLTSAALDKRMLLVKRTGRELSQDISVIDRQRVMRLSEIDVQKVDVLREIKKIKRTTNRALIISGA